MNMHDIVVFAALFLGAANAFVLLLVLIASPNKR